MSARRTRPIIVKRVNWPAYAISLPLIVLFGYAALMNWISGYFVLIALFLAVFWVLSLIFALATLLRKPVEPRQ